MNRTSRESENLFKKKVKRRAFSMIELSVVILIIGILVSGILASNVIIKKFRIQTAQTLTMSSPVQGIPDSVLWLESSLDKSFKESESSDTTSLSAWYDVRESVNKNNATQSNSGNYPTYSNSINSIQAVKFDGTNGYFSVDGSVLNNTNYTIFVLEQRESSKSGNYFIGDSSSGNESTTNKNLVLGYSADGTIKHSQSSDNSYTSSISSYSSSNGKPRVFTFVHDKASGKKTYINGLLAATSTDTNHLSGMTTLTIGKSYQGQIGEVVMFARALTTEERQSVEDYLGKKWNSKILRSVGSSSSSGGIGGSCVGGTVSDSGCLTACTVTAATGITDTTVGGGTGSLTCDTSAHFTGSLSYTCLNGSFSYIGATSCSCASGYTLSGSSCNILNPNCSGGTETTTSSGGSTYKIHTFNSSGILSCIGSGSAEILVIGGGGSGGVSGSGSGYYTNGAGGGGAGGVVYASSYAITSTTYSITVGNGGAAQSSVTAGNNGQDSVFGSSLLVAKGGGGGGSDTANAGSGGSGGGAAMIGGFGTTTQTAQTGASIYGNNGGNSVTDSGTGYSLYYAGGGGGAGGAGGTGANNSTGGAGGAGYTSSISGTSVCYAGGGAATSYAAGVLNNNVSCGGGYGGQGPGGNHRTNRAPGAGTANRGSGGGGATACCNAVGGAGGSGVVIVKYQIN